jgi:hypothetical protein
MKKISLKIPMLLGLIGLLTGCASIAKVEPGAEKIVVVKPSISSTCRWLGPISASDINGTTRVFTSRKNLQADQLNRLKNQAHRMGGNVVMVLQNQVTFREQPGYRLVDFHAMSGEAYRCGPSALRGLSSRHFVGVSANNDE